MLIKYNTMNNMLSVIKMSNNRSTHHTSFINNELFSNENHKIHKCDCFKIPKPIKRANDQPGGKQKCSQVIQTALGPHAYRNSKKRFIKIPVNHFNSFEGAPNGFGSPLKNNII